MFLGIPSQQGKQGTDPQTPETPETPTSGSSGVVPSALPKTAPMPPPEIRPKERVGKKSIDILIGKTSEDGD